MNINPYIAGAPVVEEKMFFGREGVFEWIENSLAGKYVDHILVLHGQRRVGKTSVLKHIPKRLPNRYLPILIDLQGRVSTKLPRFLWWLSREMVKALKNEGIELPHPDRKQFEDDPDYFENSFLPLVEANLGEKRILLTFDEFDTLETTDAQEGLALPFMAILKRMMEYKNLNFVFSIGSSGRKLENMQAAYTSFFKQALYRKISFLDREDGHDLITKPVDGVLKYSQDAVNRILDVTSGHPYFIQLVCHELFSECQKKDHWEINAQDVEKILIPTIERGTVNLKFVWDEANDFEKWILSCLASAETVCSIEDLSAQLQRERVRFTNQDLERSLLHLREKDVLTENNEFVIHLLRMWLKMNRPMEQVREELKEINPIVNRLLEIGQEYYEQGDFEEAVKNFEKALQEDHDNPEARLWLGNSQLGRGDYGKAVTQFEAVLETTADDVVAQKGYCDAYFAMGEDGKNNHKLAEGEFAYLQVLKINPAHKMANQRMAEIHHHRAVMAFSKDLLEALSELEEANEATNDPVYQLMVDEITALMNGESTKGDVLLMWGMQAQRLELWEDARELFKTYQKETGDEQKVSEPILEAMQKINERRTVYLQGRADRMERLGRYAESAEAWHEYLLSEPDDKTLILEKIATLEKLAKENNKGNKSSLSPVLRNSLLGLVFVIVILGIILGTRPNSPLMLAFAEPTNTLVSQAVHSTPTTRPSATPTFVPTTIPLGWSRQNSLSFLERDTITALAINPNDADLILAGTENAGVFRSFNGGISWEPASTGMGSAIITGLTYDPNDPSKLYASSHTGLYVSDNFGDQWDLVYATEIDTFIFDTNSSEIIYMSDNNGFLYGIEKTSNGEGISEKIFGKESPRPGECPIDFLQIGINPYNSDQLIGVSPRYSQCGQGIYLSENGGKDWLPTGITRPDSTAEEGNGILFHPEDPNTFMVVMDYVYRTRDGGMTWDVSLHSPCTLATAPDNPLKLVCLDNWFQKVFISENWGESWIQTYINPNFDDQITSHGGIIQISPNNSDLLYMGGEFNFLKSENNGEQWQEILNGIGTKRINLYFHPLDNSIMYLETFSNSSCPLYQSNSGGKNWELIDDDGFCGLSFSADGETMYRSQPEYWKSSLSQGDIQWNRNRLSRSNDFEGITGFTPNPIDPEKIYISTWYSLFEYDKIEKTLISLTPPEEVGSLSYRNVYVGNESEWYTFCDNTRGMFTKDAGKTWKMCEVEYEDIFSDTGNSIAINSENPDIIYAGTRGKGIYFSNTGGNSWVTTNNGLDNLYVNTIVIDPQNPDILYAGTHQGLYISFDAGETWGAINDGLLGQLIIYTLAFDPHNPDDLYATTPYGLFKLEGR
ncbi:MAG: tetratricopeptide repeat protein [Anaerolineaceae bacterium]|nr:tetratricopeptide repeat protein [Anaerolineaceae bacterium]